ncbi:hypothetical protein CHC07_05897 [Variovorax sp. B4]|nr:hypothetical protein CHC06_05991 [Variovorax sp. B2]PNG51241.1 hypothetical protein CHC07_05897 [Variovorax sp. B4]
MVVQKATDFANGHGAKPLHAHKLAVEDLLPSRFYGAAARIDNLLPALLVRLQCGRAQAPVGVDKLLQAQGARKACLLAVAPQLLPNFFD